MILWSRWLTTSVVPRAFFARGRTQQKMAIIAKTNRDIFDPLACDCRMIFFRRELTSASIPSTGCLARCQPSIFGRGERAGNSLRLHAGADKEPVLRRVNENRPLL